ncbi:hypothetical protein CVT24_005435, partial [Panaeolus cyanescens]
EGRTDGEEGETEADGEGGDQTDEGVVADVGNLSLGDADADGDGDVSMHDVLPDSASTSQQRKARVRSHKRRRLNHAGDAEGGPSAAEMEDVLNKLGNLEDRMQTAMNDAVQAEALWKEEYQELVDERAGMVRDRYEKKLMKYKERRRELEREKKKWEERMAEGEGAKWKGKGKEREVEDGDEKEARDEGEMEGDDESRWVRLLFNETVGQATDGSDIAIASVWSNVKGMGDDANEVAKHISNLKAEVEQLTHELALEKVAFADTQGKVELLTQQLNESTQRQQELSTALSTIDTYIRNTVDEITAHQASHPPAPTPAPTLPSRAFLLQSIEPQLIDSIRSEVEPLLVKVRGDVEKTVQEGAKQLMGNVVNKLGVTMNILEALHRRMQMEEKGSDVLGSLAEGIHAVGGTGTGTSS